MSYEEYDATFRVRAAVACEQPIEVALFVVPTRASAPWVATEEVDRINYLALTATHLHLFDVDDPADRTNGGHAPQRAIWDRADVIIHRTDDVRTWRFGSRFAPRLHRVHALGIISPDGVTSLDVPAGDPTYVDGFGRRPSLDIDDEVHRLLTSLTPAGQLPLDH